MYLKSLLVFRIFLLNTEDKNNETFDYLKFYYERDFNSVFVKFFNINSLVFLITKEIIMLSREKRLGSHDLRIKWVIIIIV